MSQHQLAFDDVMHTYMLNSRVVPGVTSVIQSLTPGWQAGEWYLQRGRAVHHACALLVRGKLDWNTVDPVMVGRVRACERFLDDWHAETLAVEQPLGHPLFQYGGMLDLATEREGKIVIVDWKSVITPQVRPQLGAYSLLWSVNNHGRKVSQAVAVELHDDERYRCQWVQPAELREAERVWLAMLSVHNFCTKYGIKRAS